MKVKSILDAINRQLAHYPYHIGQIVLCENAQARRMDRLSIPKK
jgi:hypothetical protein